MWREVQAGRTVVNHKASCCSSLVGSSADLSGGIKMEAIRLDQVRPELNHLDALRPSGSATLPR